MFRVSQHPSSGVLETVPAATGTGHTTCTATPLQRGLIGTAVLARVICARLARIVIFSRVTMTEPIPATARSKAWFCVRSFFGIAG